VTAHQRYLVSRPNHCEGEFAMRSTTVRPLTDEHRRWLRAEYTRLYWIARHDADTACGLDRALIELRLRDVAAALDCVDPLRLPNWLAGVRALRALLNDLEGVCWPVPTQKKVRA